MYDGENCVPNATISLRSSWHKWINWDDWLIGQQIDTDGWQIYGIFYA